MQIDIRKYSLLLLIIALTAQAWVNPEYLENRFFSAVESFRSGDYKAAHLGFSDLLIDSRGSRYYPMTYFMLALSSYKASDYESSAREFDDFAGKFPENPASARAWTYKGNSLFLTGQYLEAVKAYLYALDSPSADDETKRIALESARSLLWAYLNKDQLIIIDEYAEGSSVQFVDYMRAKRHEYSGETSKALDICTRSLHRRPDGTDADSLKALSNRISSRISSNLAVSVFAPTSGDYTEYGQNMINGVRLAFDQFEGKSRKKIDLVIENTGADILVGAYSARRAFDSKMPVVSIGPLVSDVAVSVGAFCDQYRVPMITPTASKDGLAGLSPYMFQVATPPSIGAEKLAEYAFNQLGITRFSALAPDDPVGRKAVANFGRKIEELGGEMVSVSYYAEGTVDFSEHLKHIREPYFEQMQRQVARAETTDTRFYKPNGTMREEDEWIIDIPALFVPAYYEDLLNILPQVPFNYIRTKLLGANGWIIDEVKSMESSSIDSAVVVADNFWVDSENPLWESFAHDYRRAYGAEPDRIAALGYDTAKIVCRAFSSEAITPDQMRDYLSGVTDYFGPSGGIEFDVDGTNISANLIMFDKRTPKRIERND